MPRATLLWVLNNCGSEMIIEGLLQLKAESQWVTIVDENSVVCDDARPAGHTRADCIKGAHLCFRFDSAAEHCADNAFMYER